MTLSLIDKNNSIVATKSGPSPVTLALTTQAGNYKLQVLSPDPISSKGLAFSLQVSYGTVSAGDSIGPTTPSNLKATADNGNQVSLVWGASTDNVGVVGYDIYRDSIKVGSSLNNTYQDTGLTPLTTYKYYVIARDAAGNSSKASSTVRVKTLGGSSGDTIPPTVPTNLVAVASSDTQINLDWTQSTDNSGIAPHYDIYVNGNLKYGNVTQPPYGDYGLTAGTTYSYHLVARDEVGNLSAPSNTVSVTTPIPDTEKPTTPSNLTATPVNSTQINLNWTGSTDNVGVANYYVYANGQNVRVLPETSLAHKYLLPSTNYSYYIVAKDAAGNTSDQSATVVARTPDPDTENPSVPGNFTVNVNGPTQVSMNWTASTDNVGVVGYKVYRNDNVIATIGQSSVSYTDITAQPNKVYLYAVEAFDNENNSSKTSEKRIYTPSSINITVTAPASGSTQAGIITVSGTASSTSGQVTKVEVAGSYGNYQSASGTANWTATVDTTKIPDSTEQLLNDPGHPDPVSRYVFVKATSETTGDFKIITVPIMIKNDTVLPTASITSPASGSTQAGFYTITGTASDNIGVKEVYIKSHNGQGGEVKATGTTNWTAVVTTQNDSFYPFDTVVVYDVNGNKSSTTFSINPIYTTYSGVISGRAYKDVNNNHIYDQGDQALVNDTVFLYAKPGEGWGQFVKTAYTDIEGKYSFTGLQDGTYKLFVWPADNRIEDWWYPNDPDIIFSSSSLQKIIDLNGSNTYDFSWRPITRNPDPANPGYFLSLNSFTGPSGLRTNQYDSIITTQEIYDRTMAGKLIGVEAKEITVEEGVRWGGGFAGATGGGYSIDNATGRCSNPAASSGIYWPYWFESSESVLFHEYGHAWQNYWSCLHQDVDLTEYMHYRGVDITDPRINTNHEWSLKEIAAEDYKQLFSAKPIAEDQENRYLPRATEIPGFKDYLTNVYRMAR